MLFRQVMPRVTHRPPAKTPYKSLWIACSLGYAAIGMTLQAMPAYAHDQLGANAAMAGTVVTIGSLATMITRPVAGRLADRHGARDVVIIGALLGLAGGLGHLLATTLPVLVLARLVLGAGEGALFTAAIGWVLDQAEPAHRGRIAGNFGLSMWSGLATGPMIGAALLMIGGYRWVWITASLFPALALALTAGTLPATKRPLADPNIHRALLPRAAWRPGAANAFASIGYGVVAAFLIPRFARLHLTGEDFALAAFGIAFIATRFLGSPAVDRFGARPVLLIAFIIEAAGLAGLALSRTTVLAFACTALTGAGLAMLYPCLASLVTQAAHRHERSAALGAVTSAWDFGLAISGPLGGFVAGTSDTGPFALAACAASLATLPLASGSKAKLAAKPQQRSLRDPPATPP